jgi:Cytochrome c peroxidase
MVKYRKSAIIAVLMGIVLLSQCKKERPHKEEDNNPVLINDGQQVFRYDTFGDEDFWSGLLHIDKALLGSANGGFGPGVSPKTALAVGLKVDAKALPASVVEGIKSGAINLDDPATTLALLKLDAVVGVKGTFEANGKLRSVGITCASCHSNVDNSFANGIGNRLDGWPNRDLNVGAIISLTDNARPIADMLHVDEGTLRTVLGLWGPGKFAAGIFMDGKALRPDGKVAANLIPAAFGLKGITLTTYTGWGDISYWNAFVGNLEMHGKGTFSDPRLNDQSKYPIATENRFYNVMNNPDLITSKLPALKAYQHSIPAPKPPAGSYNQASANLGKALFLDKAKCASCHAGPLFADNILHAATEIGIDDFEAKRSPTGKYRTTPLGGLFARTKGGFYHDGRFATLNDVVTHYDNHLHLNLTATEKQNLVEYLKSI